MNNNKQLEKKSPTENNDLHIKSENLLSDSTMASASKTTDLIDVFDTKDPFQSSPTTGSVNSKSNTGAPNLSPTDPFSAFTHQNADQIDNSIQTNTNNNQGSFALPNYPKPLVNIPQPFGNNSPTSSVPSTVSTIDSPNNYDKFSIFKTSTENSSKDRDISGINLANKTSPSNNYDTFQAQTTASSKQGSNPFNVMNSSNTMTTSPQVLNHFTELRIDNSNHSGNEVFGSGSYGTLSAKVGDPIKTSPQGSISNDTFAGFRESDDSANVNTPSKIFHSQSDYDLVPVKSQKSDDAEIDNQSVSPVTLLQSMSTEEKEVELLKLMNKPPPPKPPRRNAGNSKSSESMTTNQSKFSRAPQYPAPVLQQQHLTASKASQKSNIQSENKSWSTVYFKYLLLINIMFCFVKISFNIISNNIRI